MHAVAVTGLVYSVFIICYAIALVVTTLVAMAVERRREIKRIQARLKIQNETAMKILRPGYGFVTADHRVR